MIVIFTRDINDLPQSIAWQTTYSFNIAYNALISNKKMSYKENLILGILNGTISNNIKIHVCFQSLTTRHEFTRDIGLVIIPIFPQAPAGFFDSSRCQTICVLIFWAHESDMSAGASQKIDAKNAL